MAPKPQPPRTLYQRLKIDGKGWRYQRVKTGRGIKTGDLTGPFYLHVVVGRKPNGKPDQQWKRMDGDTFDAATESADELRDVMDATAKGLKVEGGRRFQSNSDKDRGSEFPVRDREKQGQEHTRSLHAALKSICRREWRKVRFIDEVNDDTLKDISRFSSGREVFRKDPAQSRGDRAHSLEEARRQARL